ncbi:hypothetical protein PULV_a2964 [Pseudoalteromonas ulvae UL12]|uniref:hypothetical protein n=1 Tax=Pseudoalteromonas ulvae TaxID=107327 RepID=UPI00186BA69D|nr:hypothetical protein [Pseudoalteromonas ulvae]MBE0362349.1 hypothetical protein [Pseudoalteromonas ulvae UL12]
MRLLIISDIFGLTPAFLAFAELFEQAHQVHCLSPYPDSPPEFNNDTQAYEYFLSSSGHEQYQQQILSFLKQHQGVDTIIAFSAGASALWQVSAHNELSSVKNIISFYPSQIRNQLRSTPRVPTHLIFPISEPHFSVDAVLEQLAGRVGVSVEKTNFYHGFMNAQSRHFDSYAYQQFSQKIVAQLSAL